MEQMYSIKSAAKLLDVSAQEIRSLGRQAGISFYKVGDSTRISETGLRSIVHLTTEGTPQMLSLNRSAEILDISTRTLRRLILQKNLPTFRVGSHIRIKQTDLSILIDEQMTFDDY
ncbi:MAG: excisionase family DNA-binding protein [Candidatus Marinimicrobia bacterium]|jgi:excisionase family DNA binding protein|nr:excisionase family DNA-binding protein [Candidatus Neomarinimicrobiota bacterium]